MTYFIYRLFDNLFDLIQLNPSKTAKHWDSFLSNCILKKMSKLAMMMWIQELTLKLMGWATQTLTTMTEGARLMTTTLVMTGTQIVAIVSRADMEAFR